MVKKATAEVIEIAPLKITKAKIRIVGDTPRKYKDLVELAAVLSAIDEVERLAG